MRIKNEADILDPKVRKAIIDEIRGPENQARKDEAFKRYMCFKDFTSRYVSEGLLRQFDAVTVEEMMPALTNISITKKIINKLARVYNFGVKRSLVDESGAENKEGTKSIEEQSRILKMNTQMKMANRYLKLQRNIAIHPCPIPEGDKYKIGVKVLQPYLYDVIENDADREQAMVTILSNYEVRTPMKASLNPQTEGRTSSTVQLKPLGDGRDQAIADTPTDLEYKEYVWWTDNYHFTTDQSGEYVATQKEGIFSNVNPLGEMPFVFIAIDQDGSFWAQGGQDISDGAIMINSLLTNVNHIGITQGYGQFWMKGENLPVLVKLGPTKSIRMEYNKETVEPDLGFATANAPLEDLKAQIEMSLALLLTTNNLSTSGVSVNLSGGSDFPSGIAMILDKAESTEDVDEQSQIFHDSEPLVWKKIQLMEAVYESQGLLCDELRMHKIPPEPKVNLKFGKPQPIQSEAEHLDALTKRKDLGLNTEIELIMKDDPALTSEQAEEKLKKIREEKEKRMLGAVIESNQGKGESVPNDSEDKPGDAPEDTPDLKEENPE